MPLDRCCVPLSIMVKKEGGTGEEKSKGLFSKFKRAIKNQDILAPTIASEMTFGKDSIQNTYAGGIASLAMYGAMVYIVISQGLLMVNN